MTLGKLRAGRQETERLRRDLELLRESRAEEIADAYLAGHGDGILAGLRIAADSRPAPVLQLVGKQEAT